MNILGKSILCGILAGTALYAQAQDSYDAQNLTTSDLNGTSRFVAMGGALGALGGDISVMSTNPAGTAMYRRSDAAISLSGVFSGKGAMDHDGARMSLDQGGVLIAFDMENPSDKGVQFVNFGVNYQKKRNFLFNQLTDVQNLNSTFSQTFQIADLCTDAWANDYYGSLADMSASVFKDPRRGGILLENYYDKDGNLLGNSLFDNPGNIYLDPKDADKVDYVEYQGIAADKAYYEKATYGSNIQADINLSLNVSDQFFIGASLGIYNMDYTRESFYQELGVDGYTYDFTNWYNTTSDGFDVKLGFICRPFEDSPFRFGVSVHSPIWYRMVDANGSMLYLDDNYVTELTNSEYEYDFRTPWKFGVSLGHTIGQNIALGAEYEYQDLSSAKYSSIDGYDASYFRNVNDMTKETLCGQHTLKLGAEYKPVEEISIRLGYNYVSSPFKEGAYRTIGYDGPYTETDYTNWGDINRFCFGLGYRYKGGYIDLAYQYQLQKGDFYAFDDIDLKPTKLNCDRSQLMATFGFRF